MESWFLADRQTLELFYRQGFQGSALPADPNIEGIAKRDVLAGLNQATRNTSKGRYSKGRHSFDLLRELNPDKVTKASPYTHRFVEYLRNRTI